MFSMNNLLKKIDLVDSVCAVPLRLLYLSLWLVVAAPLKNRGAVTLKRAAASEAPSFRSDQVKTAHFIV